MKYCQPEKNLGIILFKEEFTLCKCLNWKWSTCSEKKHPVLIKISEHVLKNHPMDCTLLVLCNFCLHKCS